MKIELSKAEYELLLWAIKVAASEMRSVGNLHAVGELYRLANTINKDNPGWTPYQLPDAPE